MDYIFLRTLARIYSQLHSYSCISHTFLPVWNFPIFFLWDIISNLLSVLQALHIYLWQKKIIEVNQDLTFTFLCTFFPTEGSTAEEAEGREGTETASEAAMMNWKAQGQLSLNVHLHCTAPVPIRLVRRFLFVCFFVFLLCWESSSQFGIIDIFLFCAIQVQTIKYMKLFSLILIVFFQI